MITRREIRLTAREIVGANNIRKQFPPLNKRAQANGVCALFCSPLCQHIDRQPQPAKNDYHNWKYLIIPMPTTIALLLALLVSFATLARADCKDTGKPVWSKQVLDIVADCETRIISPDRRTILIMKSDGDLGISDAKGKSLKAIGYRVEPPAMASWSPDSKAFFINNGEGSGMASNFSTIPNSPCSCNSRRFVTSSCSEAFQENNCMSIYRSRPKCIWIWLVRGRQAGFHIGASDGRSILWSSRHFHRFGRKRDGWLRH
jgi:hypothetical protein